MLPGTPVSWFTDFGKAITSSILPSWESTEWYESNSFIDSAEVANHQSHSVDRHVSSGAVFLNYFESRVNIQNRSDFIFLTFVEDSEVPTSFSLEVVSWSWGFWSCQREHILSRMMKVPPFPIVFPPATFIDSLHACLAPEAIWACSRCFKALVHLQPLPWMFPDAYVHAHTHMPVTPCTSAPLCLCKCCSSYLECFFLVRGLSFTKPLGPPQLEQTACPYICT